MCRAMVALLALASLAGWPGKAVADGMYACGAQRLPPRVMQVVQQSLKRAGFDPGREDGVYSTTTSRALVTYARSHYGSADKDLVMVTDLLTDSIGAEETQKLLPPLPNDQARKHRGLECTW